jgi:hypothetical protein
MKARYSPGLQSGTEAQPPRRSKKGMILLAFILGLAAGFGLFLWLDDRTL